MRRLILALALLPLPTLADTLPGYHRLSIPAAHRAAPLNAALWYPATQSTPSMIGQDAVFMGTGAMMDAPALAGLRPLVLFSHGSGGNMDNMGWLAADLVDKGAIVLGVNHPGSTSRDSHAQQSARSWDRPADLTAALDAILADPAWQGRIDPTRISVLGFSMGGATALQLMGVQTSRARFAAHCAEAAAAPDCSFLTRGGVELTTLAPEWEANHRDPRISSAVVIDAGYSHAMTPVSLGAVTQPVLLINLGTTGSGLQAAGMGPEGGNIAPQMPRAIYVEIPRAIHFTFLGLCGWTAPALLWISGEEPICSDPWFTDRAAVHDQIAAAVTAFLLPGA